MEKACALPTGKFYRVNVPNRLLRDSPLAAWGGGQGLRACIDRPRCINCLPSFRLSFPFLELYYIAIKSISVTKLLLPERVTINIKLDYNYFLFFVQLE